MAVNTADLRALAETLRGTSVASADAMLAAADDIDLLTANPPPIEPPPPVEPPPVEGDPPGVIHVGDGDLRAAYDRLHSRGGVLYLDNGRAYDVGDGLVIANNKPVAIIGQGRVRSGRDDEMWPGCAPRIWSSSNAQVLIDIPHTGWNLYGVSLRDIDLQIPHDADGHIAIRAMNLNMTEVRGCHFYHQARVPEGPFFTAIQLEHETGGSKAGKGDDSSWWRIENNHVRRGTLVDALGSTTTQTGTPPHQTNNFAIRDNVCFGGSPVMLLRGCHRTTISNNNVETQHAGIVMEGCWGNTLVGNGGEGTNPFMLLRKCYGNTLLGVQGISYGGSGDVKRVYARFENSAGNLIVTAVATGYANLYGYKEWVEDVKTDPNDPTKWIESNEQYWMAPGFGGPHMLRVSHPWEIANP